MALHSQRRNRDIRRTIGGFLAVWGRVLASLGMVMTALVGVTVATQSAASASTFGPDAFMDFAGRPAPATPAATVQWDGTGAAGWANGTNASPTNFGTCTNANADAAHVGGIHVPGTNGLYDCGAKIPSFPPTAGQVPQFHNQGTGVFDQAFVPTPTNGDTVTGCGTGSYTFNQNIAKFNQDFSQMQFSVSGSEPKGQISNVYAVGRQSSNGHDEVYVGLERPVASGDEHTDFQFLQEPVSLASNCGPNFTSGVRESGDLVLEINFTNGGNLANPNVYLWSCTGTLPIATVGTPCSNSTNPSANWASLPECPSNGPCYPAGSISIDANQAGPIDCGGWVCTAGSNANHNTATSSTIPMDGFMEAAIDLDTLGVNTGCSSTFLALTRSSQSFTSQMKHFSPPHTFDTCSPTETHTTPNSSTGAIGTGIGTSPAGITLGQSAHDVAVVTPTGVGVPASTPPTGTVNFFVCGPFSTAPAPTATGCSVTDTTRKSVGTAAPATGIPGTPTANATTFNSSDITPQKPGFYCFEADFVPSGKFEASSDALGTECFHVAQLTPGFVTNVIAPTAANSSVNCLPSGFACVGNGWNDQAVLTAPNGTSPAFGAPLGTVAFSECAVISPATSCNSGGTAVGSVDSAHAIVSGTTATYNLPAGDAFFPSKPGTYCYYASFTTDTGGNYASKPIEDNQAAECFQVGPAPSVSKTVATGNTIVGGSGIFDDLTVTGNAAGGDPTGTVNFYLCHVSTSANTPGPCAVSATPYFTTTLSPGSAPNTGAASTSSVPFGGAGLTAGTWCFSATYLGDPVYLGSADNTTNSNLDNNECVTVASAKPTVATSVVQIGTSNVTGVTYKDTATVTGAPGGPIPQGSVTYNLYEGACGTGNLIGSWVETLDGSGNVPDSPASSPLGAGPYCYLATFNPSDNNYSSATAPPEPFSVNKASLTTNTTVFDATNPPSVWAASGELAPASSFDTASLTGLVAGFDPTGTFSYTLYKDVANGDCLTGTTVLATYPKVAYGAATPTFANLAAGSYGYLATYSGDANYQPSTGTCEPFKVITPILKAVKTASPAPITTPGTGIVNPGQVITYTVTLTNTGDADATNVTVTDAVPAGTIAVANSASGTSGTGSLSSTLLTWTFPTVASGGGTQSVQFQVTVGSGDVNGQDIFNHAVFTNEGTPSADCITTGGDTTAATCDTNTVEHVVEFPIVDAVKSSSPTSGTTVPAGSDVTYTISLTNVGLLPATETITDVVPSGTTFVSASNGSTPVSGLITWSNVLVPAGTTSANPVQVSFVVTVNLNDADGTVIPNHAVYNNVSSPNCISSADTTASTCDTNTVTLKVIKPIINVVKSEPTPGDTVTVIAGQSAPITYNLTVLNTGSEPAADVTVTDVIPTGATYVPGSADATGGTFDPGTKTISWDVKNVPGAIDATHPGTVAPLSFQVTVDAADANNSVITNQASFSDINTVDCLTPLTGLRAPTQGTCLTNTVTNPVVKPIINVVKSEPTPGNGQTVTAGQSAPITYSLSVTNAGSAVANDVTVTDVIPNGSTYVANSANLGGTFNSTTNTVSWDLASVPAATNATTPGTAGPLTFQVTVNSSDANGSTITNQAAFTDVNTVNCTAATVQGMCLTNQVSNPVVAITPTPATAPQVTTTTLKPKLAFTGTNAKALAIFAIALVGSGMVLVLIGRRRNRGNI